ncbi:MAG: AAA family ATPase [Candidatus Dormibacteria bacterium]
MGPFEALDFAFSPREEIDDPERYAGRVQELTLGVSALNSRGVVPVIHGARGIGKSSLARQLRLLASGDTRLRDLRSTGAALTVHRTQRPYFIKCPSQRADTMALLAKVRRAVADDIGASYRDGPTSSETRQYHFLPKGIGLGKDRAVDRQDPAMARLDTPEDEVLVDVIRRHQQRYKCSALIVLDDIDTLAHMSGLAQVLKSVDPELAQFMLVGVAATAEELLDDHESIGRFLRPIEVALMTTQELEDIFAIARRRIDAVGLSLTYAPSAVDTILGEAGGLPYIVQALARDAGQKCLELSSSVVTEEHLSRVILDLTKATSWQMNELAYRKAVGRSAQRGDVLYICATHHENDISISVIASEAKLRYSHANPYQVVDQLTSGVDSVLIKVPGSDGFVRFRDPLLKWYTRRRVSSAEQAR